MELGHPSRDCPRFNRTATYPCSQCRNQGRIAFLFINECKEMIGSQALSPAPGPEEKWMSHCSVFRKLFESSLK